MAGTKSTLASLLVSLDVESAQLKKGLRSAAKDVDAFNRHAERAGKVFGKAFGGIEQASMKVAAASMRVAQAGLGVATVFAGAARAASKYDRDLRKATETTSGQFAALSVEMGKVALPLITELNDKVGSLVRAFRALTPEQKEAIADFVSMAAKVGAAALVFAKLSALVGGLAGVIKTAFDVATLHPFLAALAAIAATAGLVVATLNAKANLDRSEAWQKEDDTLTRRHGTAADRVAQFRQSGGRGQAMGGGDMSPGLFAENLRIFKDDARKALDALNAHRGARPQDKSITDHLLETFPGLAAKVKDATDAFSGLLNGGGGAVDTPKDISDEVDWTVQTGFGARGAQARQGSSIAALGVRMDERIFGYASTFMDSVRRAFERAGEMLISRLLSVSGVFGDVIISAMEGMEAGGPMAAAVNAIAALLTNSETFRQIGEVLNRIMQTLADTVGKAIAWILPVLDIFSQLANLFAMMAPVLRVFEPVYRLLFEAIKNVAITITGFLLFFASAWNKVIQLIAWVAERFGQGEWAKKFRAANMVDTAAMTDGLHTLIGTTYDAAAANSSLAAAATSAAESLLNVPSGYNLNLAKQQLGMATVGGSDAGGGGGGVTVNGDVNVTVSEVTTPGALGAAIKKELRTGAWRAYGTPAGREAP